MTRHTPVQLDRFDCMSCKKQGQLAEGLGKECCLSCVKVNSCSSCSMLLDGLSTMPYQRVRCLHGGLIKYHGSVDMSSGWSKSRSLQKLTHGLGAFLGVWLGILRCYCTYVTFLLHPQHRVSSYYCIVLLLFLFYTSTCISLLNAWLLWPHLICHDWQKRPRLAAAYCLHCPAMSASSAMTCDVCLLSLCLIGKVQFAILYGLQLIVQA